MCRKPKGSVVYYGRKDQSSRSIRPPFTEILTSCHGVLISCTLAADRSVLFAGMLYLILFDDWRIIEQ